MNVNVYIDESGSMDGARLAIAHSLTIALRHRLRDDFPIRYSVYGFSGAAQLRHYSSDSEMLRSFYRAGTDFNQVLNHAVNSANAEASYGGETTALLITDGHCHVDGSVVDRLKKTPNLRLTIISLDEGTTIDSIADKAISLVRSGTIGYGPDVVAQVVEAVKEVWETPAPDPEPEFPLNDLIAKLQTVAEEFIQTFIERSRTPGA